MGWDINLICTRCQSCRTCRGHADKYTSFISNKSSSLLKEISPPEDHLFACISNKKGADAAKTIRTAIDKLESTLKTNPKKNTPANNDLLSQLTQIYVWATGNPELIILIH